jgi:hypothetical protein
VPDIPILMPLRFSERDGRADRQIESGESHDEEEHGCCT